MINAAVQRAHTEHLAVAPADEPDSGADGPCAKRLRPSDARDVAQVKRPCIPRGELYHSRLTTPSRAAAVAASQRCPLPQPCRRQAASKAPFQPPLSDTEPMTAPPPPPPPRTPTQFALCRKAQGRQPDMHAETSYDRGHHGPLDSVLDGCSGWAGRVPEGDAEPAAVLPSSFAHGDEGRTAGHKRHRSLPGARALYDGPQRWKVAGSGSRADKPRQGHRQLDGRDGDLSRLHNEARAASRD
eukprot:363740-Chlamydomonas_euryale.AAC.14